MVDLTIECNKHRVEYGRTVGLQESGITVTLQVLLILQRLVPFHAVHFAHYALLTRSNLIDEVFIIIIMIILIIIKQHQVKDLSCQRIGISSNLIATLIGRGKEKEKSNRSVGKRGTCQVAKSLSKEGIIPEVFYPTNQVSWQLRLFTGSLTAPDHP